MKIKLAIPDENMEEIRQFFEEKGFTIDEDADYILTQRQRYVGHLSVRNPGNGDKAFVDVNDILYIESFGHQMDIVTLEGTWNATDPLYQLLEVLDPDKFTRISKSVIIAKRKVKEIRPSFSMKYVLIMQDGKHLEVTRSYYNRFRDAFNI